MHYEKSVISCLCQWAITDKSTSRIGDKVDNLNSHVWVDPMEDSFGTGVNLLPFPAGIHQNYQFIAFSRCNLQIM